MWLPLGVTPVSFHFRRLAKTIPLQYSLIALEYNSFGSQNNKIGIMLNLLKLKKIHDIYLDMCVSLFSPHFLLLYKPLLAYISNLH